MQFQQRPGRLVAASILFVGLGLAGIYSSAFRALFQVYTPFFSVFLFPHHHFCSTTCWNIFGPVVLRLACLAVEALLISQRALSFLGLWFLAHDHGDLGLQC